MEKMITISPDLHPTKVMENAYSKTYTNQQVHDSPERTRINMVRQIYSTIHEKARVPNIILDIGSGPQCLEKQLMHYRDAKEILENTQLVTLDFATFPSYRLRAFKKAHHLRAHGLGLPFPSGSIDLVISNLAIDFMGRDALSEAMRVMSPDGAGIFFFHHPHMIRDGFETDKKVSDATRIVWKYLKDNNLLYENEGEIKSEMATHGLEVVNLLKSEYDSLSRSDTWWEVQVKKAPTQATSATTSTSIFAPLGRAATLTQDRAGHIFGK